jgi:dTDP-4-dehydrorhamnose reductase
MLANECRAVLLSMRAIRRVVPDAQLVQTEDLGRTFSTAPLAYQAAHENERRWLSLDLLCGRVDRAHPWWPRLRAAGVAERELDDFRAGDLGPMVIGVNYYITSERFLDHRLALYPPHLHGGNGRDAYADIESARGPLPPHEATGWSPGCARCGSGTARPRSRSPRRTSAGARSTSRPAGSSTPGTPPRPCAPRAPTSAP